MILKKEYDDGSYAYVKAGSNEEEWKRMCDYLRFETKCKKSLAMKRGWIHEMIDRCEDEGLIPQSVFKEIFLS